MTPPLNIAIVGAGFAGIALTAHLYKLTDQPLNIILIDKSGRFAKGPAYSTPFAYHLLNVRAKDMSALHLEATHFVDWCQANEKAATFFDSNETYHDQFTSRCLYGDYLNDLLQIMLQDKARIQVSLISDEVVDVTEVSDGVTLFLRDAKPINVDKVVLALGNDQPQTLPFPVANEMHILNNPWDYQAPARLSKETDVLIMGTGLSMIDTVLTLHHEKHRGKIYALSRHGLLPRPHNDTQSAVAISSQSLPKPLSALVKSLRHQANNMDWRLVVNALRHHGQTLWSEASLKVQKQFLRHLATFWNVHRHRVHPKLSELLQSLEAQGQLSILSGRVEKVSASAAFILKRHTQEVTSLPIQAIINCMGPSAKVGQVKLIQRLVQKKLAQIGPLNIGLRVTQAGALLDENDQPSSVIFALSTLRKESLWETTAVPEIRKQCFDLAKYLLKMS